MTNEQKTPTQVGSESGEQAGKPGLSMANMAEAAFSKLPTLGPIAWLYARTPDRRFLFLTDLDWAVMPPVMLDQCRLFLRGKMPFAFVTWALVNDDVHQRLLAGNGKLAPHEWKSGTNLWLIDVVTPFGALQEILADVQKNNFPGLTLRYLTPNPLTQKIEVQVFTGLAATPPQPASGSQTSPTDKVVH